MQFNSKKTFLFVSILFISLFSTYGAAAVVVEFKSFFVEGYNSAIDIGLIDKDQSKQLEKEKVWIHAERFAKHLLNHRDSIAHSLDVRKDIFRDHQKAYRRLMIWEIERRIKAILGLGE